MSKKKKVIIIVGQTASGKTSTAIKLAQDIGGEVISADSRQVYKYLDIGTDKVTAEQMQGVPHHLLDIANPTNEIYTVSNFINDATVAIQDIINRGKVPIVAGGTMLYIDALLGKVLVPEVAPDKELRAELETRSAQELFVELQSRDPRRAKQMQQEGQDLNKRRLVRALEVVSKLGSVPNKHEQTNKVVSDLLATCEILWLGLCSDQAEQKEKINKRNAEMLKNGLLDEVQSLIDMGVTQEQFDTFGFEYKYPTMYLTGTPIIQDKPPTLEQVLMKMNSGTWRYAKKQRAWWQNREDIHWHNQTTYSQLLDTVSEFLN
jgi:tRNA dimethylallyltransferase